MLLGLMVHSILLNNVAGISHISAPDQYITLGNADQFNFCHSAALTSGIHWTLVLFCLLACPCCLQTLTYAFLYLTVTCFFFNVPLPVLIRTMISGSTGRNKVAGRAVDHGTVYTSAEHNEVYVQWRDVYRMKNSMAVMGDFNASVGGAVGDNDGSRKREGKELVQWVEARDFGIANGAPVASGSGLGWVGNEGA